MPNRILSKITSTRNTITKKVDQGLVSAQKIYDLQRDLDMELDEYVRFQELKSLAVATGKLSLEEGQTIYGYLGESLSTFNSQLVEVKIVLTQVYSELLASQISSLQRA